MTAPLVIVYDPDPEQVRTRKRWIERDLEREGRRDVELVGTSSRRVLLQTIASTGRRSRSDEQRSTLALIDLFDDGSLALDCGRVIETIRRHAALSHAVPIALTGYAGSTIVSHVRLYGAYAIVTTDFAVDGITKVIAWGEQIRATPFGPTPTGVEVFAHAADIDSDRRTPRERLAERLAGVQVEVWAPWIIEELAAGMTVSDLARELATAEKATATQMRRLIDGLINQLPGYRGARGERRIERAAANVLRDIGLPVVHSEADLPMLPDVERWATNETLRAVAFVDEEADRHAGWAWTAYSRPAPTSRERDELRKATQDAIAAAVERSPESEIVARRAVIRGLLGFRDAQLDLERNPMP